MRPFLRLLYLSKNSWMSSVYAFTPISARVNCNSFIVIEPTPSMSKILKASNELKSGCYIRFIFAASNSLSRATNSVSILMRPYSVSIRREPVLWLSVVGRVERRAKLDDIFSALKHEFRSILFSLRGLLKWTCFTGCTYFGLSGL